MSAPAIAERAVHDTMRLFPGHPQFADGPRQLAILEAELASNRAHAWKDVPA